MANSFFFFLLPLLLFILTTRELLENVVVVVKGDPDLTLISAFCGKDHDGRSLRKDQAGKLADSAIEYTRPGAPTCSGTGGNPSMYSRATCSDAISEQDCKDCLTYAKDQLVQQNICRDRYGAQITVASCSLRFEPRRIAGDCRPGPLGVIRRIP